jgi:tetratricopeptide (TPR) repeat protein
MEEKMVRAARFFTMISLVLVLSVLFGATPAQSQASQDLLRQYVADLQKNPSDYPLREKIIRHVQTMKPAPAIPEEARRQYIMGKTLFEDARNVKDFNDAIEKFRKALLIAPWWPEANRDLGMALQAAQQYDEAIRMLKLYIAGNPGEELTRRTQNEIYKIEARREKAVNESSPAAISAKKQKEYEAWLKKIDGRRYRESRGGSGELEVRGKFIVLSAPGVSLGPWEIRGRSASTPRVMQRPPLPVQTTFIFNEDGDRIIEHRDFSDGDALEFVWVWQR